MPGIGRQFRSVEDLLESTERKDTINFVGTDISPVVDIDPGTLRLGQLVMEFSSITGPTTFHILATPPAGFYRQYLRIGLEHNDPTARDLHVVIRDAGAGLNVEIAVSTARPPGLAINLRGGPVVPPFFIRGEVTGLVAPFTSSMIAYVLELPLGAPQPKNI